MRTSEELERRHREQMAVVREVCVEFGIEPGLSEDDHLVVSDTVLGSDFSDRLRRRAGRLDVDFLPVDFRRVHLVEFDFFWRLAPWSTLVEVTAESSAFRKAELTKSEVRDCTFTECNFAGADFYRSTLDRVVFDRCSMFNASFDRTHLHDVQFVKPTFGKVHFSETTFRQVEISEPEFDLPNFVSDIDADDDAIEEILGRVPDGEAGP